MGLEGARRRARPRVLGARWSASDAPGPDADPEALLAPFFSDYVEQGQPGAAQLVRRPRRLWRALRAARDLPVVEAHLSDTAEARLIREGLTHVKRRTYKTAFLRTPLHAVTSLLLLPVQPGRYSLGASKQTLRRKTRAAERAGVHWKPVDDPAERLRLIALSEDRERSHPQQEYRFDDVDNRWLLDLDLWLVAYRSDDEPLLLAAVPVDGEWAMLSYFRTLEDSPAASDSRYLMSAVLVEELVGRGVRHLANTATMSNLPNGLRHFQRMLGYRMVRIEVAAGDSPETP